MKIYWKSEKLKKKVEKMGQANRRISKRMIQIKAADSFLDLVPQNKGRVHFLKDNLAGFFAIDICCKENAKRYICSPQGDYEVAGKKQYKKETIKELKIEKIKDYH